MARDINQITVLGNVGGDPEYKTWDNGDRQAQFSVCTSEAWKNREGEWQDKATWHRIICKNDFLLKKIERSITKGTRVFIQGQMVYREYKDSSGVIKYSAEILIPKFGNGMIEPQPSYKGNGEARTETNDDPPFETQTSGTQSRGAFDDEIPL